MTNRRNRSLRRRPAGNEGASKGFSLIEVVFAMTFLAVGVLSVALLIPIATRGVSRSQVLTSGLMAAQVKLEDLRSQDFTALTAGTFTDTTSVYVRTWTVTDSVPMSGCKKIDVTSSWTDIRGTQTAILSSYVTK